jgi:O-antigen ligase
LKSSFVTLSHAFSPSRLLLIWLIVMPFSVGLANVLLVINVLALPFLPNIRQHIKFSEFLKHPLSVIYLLLTASILWSQDILFGLRELKTNLPLILSAFVVLAHAQVNPLGLFKGIRALSLACMAAFAITAIFNLLPFNIAAHLYEPLSHWLKPFEESNRDLFGWYVPFMVRMQFGNLLSYTGIALLVMGIAMNRKKYLLESMALFFMVLAIGTRGALLGILTAFPVLAWALWRWRPMNIRPVYVLIFIGIVAGLSRIALPSFQKRCAQTKFELEVIADGNYNDFAYQHFTTLTRLYSWKNSLELWRQSPILGTGIGDYKKAYAAAYKNDLLQIDLYYHSQWLYYLCVVGILGLFLSLIAFLSWFQRQSNSSLQRTYSLAFLVFSAVIWIFDAGLLAQQDMMTLGLFSSFATCLNNRSISST